MTEAIKIIIYPVALLGLRVRKLFSYLSTLSILVYLPIKRTFFPPWRGLSSVLKTTVMQVYFTGVQALPLFLFLGLVMGLSLSLVLSAAAGVTATICSLILKEVVPLLAAFIVLGRSGTAIAVELGNMTVLGEIRLLRRMGVDPYRHVIFPRLVGVTAAIFFLGFFLGSAIAVTSALFSDDILYDFIKDLLRDWDIIDLVVLAEKEIIFGLIISMVACYQGLNLKPATPGLTY